MRPVLTFLTNALIEKIIDQATALLTGIGVQVQHDRTKARLLDRGATLDSSSQRLQLAETMIATALGSVPASFQLFDVFGNLTCDFARERVHFTPASSALYVLDVDSRAARRPNTQDYLDYVKLVENLAFIDSQSTAFIPADVPEEISDSYRLYLSLIHSRKPVVTGCFSSASFEVMKQMQLTVRGSLENLIEKPLALFSCCPTSPLKFSAVTCQNINDCARSGIPIELVSAPISGLVAPVTCVGSLILHTAETLFGIVISQTAKPGAPVLYGGAPAIFDYRFETAPMSATESMIINCAINEIGKHLQLPTQAYMALSDAKTTDAQAGHETSMGATLAALSGINNVAGPGMLDYVNTFSLEKLLFDNEICGMAQRLAQGVEPKEDFPAEDIFRQLLRDKHLIIADHTLKHTKRERCLPGLIIDRINRSRWQEQGEPDLKKRTRDHGCDA